MSFTFEKETAPFSERYTAIDEANKDSFYVTDPNRSFDAYMSVHSFGPDRDDIALAAQRVIAGGNMSPLGPYGPNTLWEHERIADAHENLDRFFEDLSISADTVYMLNPERDYSTPLTVVNVDEQIVTEETKRPIRLDTSGDFIYSYDANKILAARPADCPVMLASADTPAGKVHMLVHYSWQGAANHYVQQTAAVFDTLGVERDSLEIYLTPGGQAESFPYETSTNFHEKWPGTEGLFITTSETEDDNGEKRYRYGIDTPKFVYDQILKNFDVRPEQVFCDTSDTSAINSGYSSHGRAKRIEESNTRDIVLGIFS